MNLIEITKGCESKQNEQTEQMKSLPDITDKWKQLAKDQAAITGASDGRERRVTGEKSEDERVYPEISEKNTQSENGKTEAILRESRNARRNAEVECRNSADDRRIVRNAETQVFTAEQRRLEEQKRIVGSISSPEIAPVPRGRDSSPFLALDGAAK